MKRTQTFPLMSGTFGTLIVTADLHDDGTNEVTNLIDTEGRAILSSPSLLPILEEIEFEIETQIRPLLQMEEDWAECEQPHLWF